MSKISRITANEVLDSRGNPTVQATVTLDSGQSAKAIVPSGASTGKHEAVELRDADNRYDGKGVQTACSNIENVIAPELIGYSVDEIRSIDQKMIDLDGTANKSNLGANSILAVSMSACRAAAISEGVELFEFLGRLSANSNQKEKKIILPTPMMNVLNGGAHADNPIDFQEFMIVPWGFDDFNEALRAGVEIYHKLREALKTRGLNTGLGDEGGYAPNLNSEKEVLDLLMSSIEGAGYKPAEQVAIALDVASSEFYENGKYNLEGSGNIFTSEEFSDYLETLVNNYPIVSIEDGMDEDDWTGWEYLSKKLNDRVQLVGDDLFVTNPARLDEGINRDVANSILIKLNQIGTVTETIDVIDLATKSDYSNVVSHRSGESEDNFISDLSVAVASGQIKTGAPARSDRVAKYNRLLEIASLDERTHEGQKNNIQKKYSGKATFSGQKNNS